MRVLRESGALLQYLIGKKAINTNLLTGLYFPIEAIFGP